MCVIVELGYVCWLLTDCCEVVCDVDGVDCLLLLLLLVLLLLLLLLIVVLCGIMTGDVW
jgi:hypothetical protein